MAASWRAARSRCSAIRASILGPLAVSVDGRDVTPTAAKQRALLICLVLDSGRTVSTDRLVEAVWGTDAPPSARNLLTVYVSQLRQAIGADAIETRAGGYAVVIEPNGLDAHRFERLVAEGTRARAAGNPALAVSRLKRAFELWRGPALADVADAAFAEPEARRLEELRLTAVEELLAAELDLGHHETVATDARALTLSEPYRERPRQLLMLALYRGDRQAESLETYREFRGLLHDELGLEPTSALRDLHSAILRRDVEPAGHGRPRRPVRRSRARDVADRPAHGDRRARRSPATARNAARDRDRRRRHRQEPARGCRRGEAMRERFANGVAFVELAPLDDPGLVVGAIAQQLGVAERGDEDLLETLSRWLAPRELLVIADNLERLLDAGPTLVQLLREAPMLTILATSRRILHLSGEHVFPLQPLPDRRRGAALCGARARARPGPRSRHPRGGGGTRDLPTRRLPPARGRARGHPGRHARRRQPARRSATSASSCSPTAPATCPHGSRPCTTRSAWSTDLLSPEERTQFARLGVFSGGCSARRRAGRRRRSSRIAHRPRVDHSLLRVSGHARARCSRPSATTPLELLDRSGGRVEAQSAHAGYFASLIERIEPRGEETSTRLRLIDHDIDNFRAAMDWFEHTEEDGAALQLATGLYHYWYLRGLLREGRSRLGGPLDRGAGDPALRALALRALAGLDLVFGDIESAAERARAGIAAGHRGRDPGTGDGMRDGARPGRARTRPARRGARPHRAKRCARPRARARSRCRDRGHQPGRDRVSSGRSRPMSRRLWEGVLAWHEQHSAPESSVFALLGLGATAHAEDGLDEAERLFERAARARRRRRVHAARRPRARRSGDGRRQARKPRRGRRAGSGAPTTCSTSSPARPASSTRRWLRARRPVLARRSARSAYAMAYAAGRRTAKPKLSPPPRQS